MKVKYQPIVTDEFLSGLSSKKKIQILKVERNLLIAMLNCREDRFSANRKYLMSKVAIAKVEQIINEVENVN